MSDHFSNIDCIKFDDKISVVQQSPNLKQEFLNKNKIALSISLTNNFLSKLNDTFIENDLSYLDIINCQLSSFQIKQCERLEKRFAGISNRVKSDLKGKYKAGRKRQQYLDSTKTVAILETELFNVRELSCSLDRFNLKCLELEKRCSSLLKEMQNLAAAWSESSFENSLLNLDINGLKVKYERLNEKHDEVTSQNKELREKVSDMTDCYRNQNKERENMQSEISNLYTGNQQLLKYIESLEKTYLPQTRKPLSEMQTTNRGRLLRTIGKEAEKALWFAETYGLKPKVLTCSTENGDVTVPLSDYKSLDSSDKQNLKELVYILDKFSISDAAYHELTMLTNTLPRKYLIVQKRSELNEIFHIERTPGGSPGAYVTIESEVQRYIKTQNISNDKPLKVKLAGDGSKVSRIANFVTFTVSFPEDDNCTSVNHIRTIAILKCKETYDELKVCASPILSEFNDLLKKSEVTVDGKVYPIDLYFTGDMKFIGICLGLNSACANYACPWCCVDKNARADISKDMNHYDSADMIRTADNLNKYYTSQQFGCKNKPLIQIEPSKVVPDELHLFLRIYDVLMDNLINDCKQLDHKAKTEVLRHKTDHMERLTKTINDCGVKFNSWTDKSGNHQTTSLTGSDYRKLAVSLPEKLLFIINNETHDEVTFLWRELRDIQSYVTQESTEIYANTVFTRVKKWMGIFLGLEKKGRLGYSRVTPYMHCLLFHVPGFINRYGSLLNFSGQGVEKMNDLIKLAHQKRSNKQDQTVDELKTRKRMELLKDNCERQKRSFSKVNDNYWNEGICEIRQTKKRRIDNEIENANERYQEHVKENEKPIDEMTIYELKEKLKSMGKATRIKKREKLIEFIKANT